MVASSGPDDMLEFKGVAWLTEAGAENPVLAAMRGRRVASATVAAQTSVLRYTADNLWVPFILIPTV